MTSGEKNVFDEEKPSRHTRFIAESHLSVMMNRLCSEQVFGAFSDMLR